MKSILLSWAVILYSATILTAQETIPLPNTNPVFQLFADDIIFHIGFDSGESAADLAAGDGSPVAVVEPLTFAPGIFGGKAIRHGHLRFQRQGNIDTWKPQSAICWVCPVQWDAWPENPPDNTIKEPGFTVMTWGISLNKQRNQRWARSTLSATVNYPKSSISVHLFNTCNALQWKNNTWHLIVAVWDKFHVGLSADGKPFKYQDLKTPARRDAPFLELGSLYNPKDDILVDEFTVVDRILSDEEVSKLYQLASPRITPPAN